MWAGDVPPITLPWYHHIYLVFHTPAAGTPVEVAKLYPRFYIKFVILYLLV